MAERVAFAVRKWVVGLSAYALVLLTLAYMAASAERGVVSPWMLFFAPLTAASHWVSWDGPILPMVIMFFGVAVEWPLAGIVLWCVPKHRRRGVAQAGLVVHYLSGVVLAVSSLNQFQRAALRRQPITLLVAVGLVAYLAGQVAIWRSVRGLRRT